MSTISSLANTNYLMYSIAKKGNSSLTASDWLNGTTSSKTSASNNTNTASTLWEKYTKQDSSTSSNYWSKFSNMQSNIASVMGTYVNTASTFNTEFKSNIADLKSSASTLAQTNFQAKGTTDAESTAKLTNIIGNISSFVTDYNTNLSFFQSSSSLSNRLSDMASSFADTTYRSGSLSNIGINVDTQSGKLSIDNDKLTKALQETPDRVSNLLGSNGLAGKALDKAYQAQSQKDQLFPSFNSMISSTVKNSTAYTPSATSSNSYASTGNLIDMYF